MIVSLVFMWDFHFRIAARNRGIHGGNNPVKMEFDVRPLLVAEDDDGNSSLRKILLIANILVPSKKQLVAGLIGLLP